MQAPHLHQLKRVYGFILDPSETITQALLETYLTKNKGIAHLRHEIQYLSRYQSYQSGDSPVCKAAIPDDQDLGLFPFTPCSRRVYRSLG
ncbi:hypothetical protein Holit_01225 [Hollandina sp. SP2]